MSREVGRGNSKTPEANMKNLINSFCIISLTLIMSVSISYSQNRQAHEGRPPHSKDLLQERGLYRQPGHPDPRGDFFTQGWDLFGRRAHHLRGDSRIL